MILCALLIFIPSVGYAHTHLESSNPEDGTILNENVEEIVLRFDTPIEKLSTMTLTRDGENIELQTQTVTNNSLIGKVSNPLENGKYQVDWKIVGEDGHVIEDRISFEVNIEKVATEEAEEAEEPVVPAEEENKNTQGETETITSTPLFFILFIVLLFMIGTALLLFLRKRKNG